MFFIDGYLVRIMPKANLPVLLIHHPTSIGLKQCSCVIMLSFSDKRLPNESELGGFRFMFLPEAARIGYFLTPAFRRSRFPPALTIAFNGFI